MQPRRIVVSGYSKPLNVTFGPTQWYSLWVDCWCLGGSFEWGLNVPFRATPPIAYASKNNDEWQYRELVIALDKPVLTVTVIGMLKQHDGAALFTRISVQEELTK